MLTGNLGPLPGVQIMQVSSFSSVLINRFHYISINYDTFDVVIL